MLYKRRKAHYIGHILHGNCLLKHVIVGRIEGKTEVMERQRRRHKQLLDNLKKKEDTGNEKGSTRLHSVQNALWQKICECHTTDYGMIKFCLHFDSESLSFYTSNFTPSAPSFP